MQSVIHITKVDTVAFRLKMIVTVAITNAIHTVQTTGHVFVTSLVKIIIIAVLSRLIIVPTNIDPKGTVKRPQKLILTKFVHQVIGIQSRLIAQESVGECNNLVAGI